MQVSLKSNGTISIELVPEAEDSIEGAFMEAFRVASKKGQPISVVASCADSGLVISLAKVAAK